MFTDLSTTAQTTYAQLVDALQSASVSRCVADVPGSFNKKSIHLFWNAPLSSL